jgi:ribonuclease P protein component
MNVARSVAGLGPNRAGRNRLPSAARINKKQEIRALLQKGERKRTPNLDVFSSFSSMPQSRWGVIVPKYRHAIVERNHLKRQLKEIGRTQTLPCLREKELVLDVLVRARKEAYTAGFHTLRKELQVVMEELCLEK